MSKLKYIRSSILILFTQDFIVLKGWTKYLTLTVLAMFSLNVSSQLSLEGNVEFDLSHAENGSHYYYNEIHSQRTGWNGGFSEARLYSGFELSPVKIHFQQSLTQNLGGNSYKYQIEQLSAELAFLDDKIQFSLGRIIHPFGRFYNRQFSHQRSFLSAPLQYSYYQNISPLFGYQSNLGENGFILNGVRPWGSSTNYRYGYLNGIKLSWKSNNDRIGIDMAFGSRSSILGPFETPSQWEFTGRISADMTWAYNHGVSMRYNSFRTSQPLEIGLSNMDQISNFSQIQFGYDFELGISFFEITGELTYSNYQVPLFDEELGFTLINNEVETHSFNSFASYIDIRVEPPSISGLSFSYRIENLLFNDFINDPWDHNVYRNSLVLGYKFTRNIILRTQYSFQNVKNKSWEQNFFTTALTVHI